MMTTYFSLLRKPLQFFSGIGPQLSKRFQALGLVRGYDVLQHMPVEYEMFLPQKNLLTHGQKGSFAVEITGRLMGRRSSWVVHVRVHDSFQYNARRPVPAEVIFFQNPRYNMEMGSHWVIQGTLQYHDGRWQFLHPSFCFPRKKCHSFPLVRPKYILTRGITGYMVQKIAHKIIADVEASGFPEEWIPESIMEENMWPSWRDALCIAHGFPRDHYLSEEKIQIYYKDNFLQQPWRQRLAFDELVVQQWIFLKEKRHQEHRKIFSCVPQKDRVAGLPYALSPSQKIALQHIEEDLAQEVPMNRLIQGEVGSGKTVLALLAALQVMDAGHQVCFLVPTEILAYQHAETFQSLFSHEIYSMALIVGKRKKDYQAIASGAARILFGTHALLQEKVHFASLGLLIIDEQQRFGVDQRLSMSMRGYDSHVLFLSATPIPRTFELALCGYLKVSTVESRAQDRHVSTCVLSSQKMEDVIHWIKEKCVAHGHQAYWICPVIEESDNKPRLESVLHRVAFLEEHFPGQVGVLHGRLSSKEKIAALEEFYSKKKPILVSTTVIEVGVHVETATVMVVENSENFGLSQLHQIRGRIGRGAYPGIVFFLYVPPLSAIAKKRLEIIRAHHNGFVIAEKDWALRGGGHLLGTKQSGFSSYKMADMHEHAHLIPLAQNIVLEYEKILDKKPFRRSHIIQILDLFSSFSREGIFSAG